MMTLSCECLWVLTPVLPRGAGVLLFLPAKPQQKLPIHHLLIKRLAFGVLNELKKIICAGDVNAIPAQGAAGGRLRVRRGGVVRAWAAALRAWAFR